MGRHQEGLVHALSCQLAPTGRAVRIPRRQTCGRIVGGWGCRETPPVGVAMLLTIKDLAAQLRNKSGTLYARHQLILKVCRGILWPNLHTWNSSAS